MHPIPCQSVHPHNSNKHNIHVLPPAEVLYNLNGFTNQIISAEDDIATYSAKTGYHWLYSNKYACQYVDIPYRYNPWDYSVVFPCDLHNYGKIEWVSWNQTPYPYEFEFSK